MGYRRNWLRGQRQGPVDKRTDAVQQTAGAPLSVPFTGALSLQPPNIVDLPSSTSTASAKVCHSRSASLVLHTTY